MPTNRPYSLDPKVFPGRPATENGTSSTEARIVRCAWMLALLLRGQHLSVGRYKERFGRSLRSFRRDLTTLRDAGLIIVATLPTRGIPARYVLHGFDAERSA